MRVQRIITWLCTGALAACASVYTVVLVLMLLDGRVSEFSKSSGPHRVIAFDDEPAMFIVSFFPHGLLMAWIWWLTWQTWRRLPGALEDLAGFGMLERLRARRPIERRMAGLMMVALIVSSLLALFGLPPAPFRRAVLVVQVLLWVASTLLIPIASLTVGVVHTKEGSIARANEPWRFWRGLIKLTATWTAMLCCVLFISWKSW
ncbi:hypothetical protein ACQ86G_14265 [Roseateles chitinivorans]|uniref:hypothetical protein n=1 Tax=Roseateles chitinivorans TaxID=2917965 RepID=UPI003D67D5B3